MRAFFRNNSLSIVFFSLFLLFVLGQTFAGLSDYNQERQDHNLSEISLAQYLGTGHYWEALSENWESEFLQMAAFVILTIFLVQKGAADSKDLDNPEPEDEKVGPDAPAPVKKGGIARLFYENSLSITLLLLFITSFVVHLISGASEYSETQIAHGEPGVTPLQYLVTGRFWFESLQNWQSEFMSMGMLIVLSIFLRQRGSAQSKPVAAPNYQTGTE